MANKTTKRTLLTSIASLLLCFVMLLGTTFAWFTDNVTSTRNIIQAGNLDVELYYMNDEVTSWTKVDDSTNIFKDSLWEPGHTEVVRFKVANEGSLALKYQLGVNVASETSSVNVEGATFKLSDYIMYGLVDGEENYSRDEAIGAVSATALNVDYIAEEALLSGAEKVVTMVVYMPETVGNEANHADYADAPVINLGIKLFATQQTHEFDSFDNMYDEDSAYPAANNVNVPAGSSEPIEIKVGDVSIIIPAMAEAGVYKLQVANKSVSTNVEGTTASYDIALFKDGIEVSGVSYPVEIQLERFLEIRSLLHNGNPVNNYNYDSATGILSFETESFSPFAVTYNSLLSDDAVVSDGKIIGGTFDFNPAELDPSLAEAESEYIAIDYPCDGTTKYLVAKRENTVVVAPAATSSENGNYTVQAGNGKLYSIISGLKPNDHSTVYLLPGTYNEATTIYIYSSMDIIGLGDKDSVKVIKQSSSNSNRHLFNATGEKADYIQVTLRNMYLDATANTTGGKDNAAVQSIRKSKVKCYDLTIVKNPTNMAAIALYVNGNNAVDGVKYPAYLYVENCTLNTTKSFAIVSTAGTYKFYHNNLTYNNGTAYTQNSGSILNQSMDENDWEW